MTVTNHVDTTNLVDSTVMDVELFKTIGLYQMLYKSKNLRWYKTVFSRLLFMNFVILFIRIIPLLLYVELALATYIISTTVMGLNTFYKGYLILKHRDSLRVMLNAARFNFTTCGLRHPDALILSRRNLCLILRIFSIIIYTILALFVMQPNLIKNMFAQDHPYYTGFWTLMFVLDTIFHIINSCVLIMFDVYLVTMCFALSAQFKTIAAGYASLGHGRSSSLSPSPNYLGLYK